MDNVDYSAEEFARRVIVCCIQTIHSFMTKLNKDLLESLSLF